MLVIPSVLGMAGETQSPTMEQPRPTPRTLAKEPAVEQASPSPAPATPATARHSLDRSLVRGIAWTGAIKWLSQLLSWVSTIVVVRLLLPADYGIIGMATTYLSLVALIN